MILKVFSVFDMKADMFGQPFFDQEEASAIRTFGDAVNDANRTNQWYNHPEDFQLFLIGEFNNDVGNLIPSLPRALVMASSLRKWTDSELPLFKKNGDKEPLTVS